jgi:hypothetical protein
MNRDDALNAEWIKIATRTAFPDEWKGNAIRIDTRTSISRKLRGEAAETAPTWFLKDRAAQEVCRLFGIDLARHDLLVPSFYSSSYFGVAAAPARHR